MNRLKLSLKEVTYKSDLDTWLQIHKRSLVIHKDPMLDSDKLNLNCYCIIIHFRTINDLGMGNTGGMKVK